jgi:hypothetical protein
MMRVYYELDEIEEPNLEGILKDFLAKNRR